MKNTNTFNGVNQVKAVKIINVVLTVTMSIGLAVYVVKAVEILLSNGLF